MDDVDAVSDEWLIDAVLDAPIAVDDDADMLRANDTASGEPDDTLLDARLSRR